MSEEIKRFSLLCPFCKEVITFELREDDLESSYSGGLAGIAIPPHGNPLHSLEVYIDRTGLIRGAYPKIEGAEVKRDLQNSYIIDATSEITPQEGRAIGVEVLPFTIQIEKELGKYYNEEIFFPEVYESLKLEKRVRSTAVTPEAYLEAFKRAPKDKPIVTLVLSKRYSEGYPNALKAKAILEKEDPKRAKNLHIVDTKTTGPLMKLMMKEVLAMDEEGKNMKAILAYLKWASETHISYIYVDSLDALRKSERVGRVTTFFGNLLGLKPIIIENMNNNGDLKAFKTVRNKEAAIQEITKAIKKDYENKELIGVIFYGIITDDAKKLLELLEKETKREQHSFTMDFIGTGVAIHLSYDILGISLYPKA